MRLDLEDGTTVVDPSPEQLRDALLGLRVPGNSFAILEQQPGFYMQAVKNEDGSYDLEYRDGSRDKHFKTSSRLMDNIDLIDAFTSYLERDDGWRRRFEWEPLPLAR
jgi:hypothetical protein